MNISWSDTIIEKTIFKGKKVTRYLKANETRKCDTCLHWDKTKKACNLLKFKAVFVPTACILHEDNRKQ